MAWNLEINIIDVGQGESSFIVAYDPIANQQKTMLVDAGLPIQAETVHTYIASRLANLGLPSVDHILLSHYDGDHSGGVLALLTADNLFGICEVIARAAGEAAFDAANNMLNPNQDQAHEIAAATAAAAAAALGGYDDNAGNDYRNVAIAAGQSTWPAVISATLTNAQIARNYVMTGENIANRAVNVNLTLIPGVTKRRKTAELAGIAAGLSGGNAVARTTAAITAVFNSLKTTVNQGSRFMTNGIYRDIHLIDIGNTPHMPGNYTQIINGGITMSGNHLVQSPNINRQRTGGPNLADEVLWNSGPGAMIPAANWPASFVVARRKDIWKAPVNAIPIASGQPDNDDSIGLILRFNQFFYYTGGDLPSQGEDLIATAVMNNGLPDPSDLTGSTFFAKPHRIACFKCGHHGSDHSTSQNFLNTAMPRGAFISCGDNAFGRGEDHPTQGVINRLHGDANAQYFYMTNCRYMRNHVPASQSPPQNQLPVVGNKSRLVGDNDANNLQVGRRRGDIQLLISEAESTAGVGVNRRFIIRYYEADTTVQNFRMENITY